MIAKNTSTNADDIWLLDPDGAGEVQRLGEVISATLTALTEVKEMIRQSKPEVIESKLEVKSALIEELKNKVQSRDETIEHLKDLVKGLSS